MTNDPTRTDVAAVAMALKARQPAAPAAPEPPAPGKRDKPSPRPWSIVADAGSVKIVDARGGVVALMKAAGGSKLANAELLVRKVNP